MNITLPQPFSSFQVHLPSPTTQLSQIFTQLKLFSKQRLDTEQNGEIPMSESEIKGLKFISTKLAKLFFKNRKLPYNEVSKILIDNFASEQKDERNIKRRVYDAVNVLVAAGILVKRNNTVEMVRGRVRGRGEDGKKGRLQDGIREKSQSLETKRAIYEGLSSKHKLIKKLFSRNMKHSNSTQPKPSSLKKSRTRQDIPNHPQPRAILPFSPATLHPGTISEPRLFIFTSQNIGSRKVQSSIMRDFQTSDRVQMIVPYNKKSAPMLLESSHSSNDKDSKWVVDAGDDRFGENCEFDAMVEEDQEEMGFARCEHQGKRDQAIEQNSQSIGKLITQYGIYSLLDLLELLSLGQIEDK